MSIWVLTVFQGAQIPFLQVPVQDRVPFPYRLGVEERGFMDREIVRMLAKGIVEESAWEEGQFVSNVFLRPKASGEFRVILDLTQLNYWIEYEPFKMTSLQTATEMLRPGCWMGSVDLKDAYYSVPLAQEFNKFLKFMCGGKLYQFLGMPNGLSSAPRLFTKVLTPVFASLRELGHECFPYIDDSFVVADTQEDCQESLIQLAHTLDQLGFVVHDTKSQLLPTTKLVFLGFELDSLEMTVGLTLEKREKFARAASEVLGKVKMIIRELAGLVGLMVAYSPAVQYGGGGRTYARWSWKRTRRYS